MKTNAMRILDQKKIKYEVIDYTNSNLISGIEVADYLNIDYEKIFKTLVSIGKSGRHYVFVIPVIYELDLKKCALLVNEKDINLVKQKDLLNLTGYIHGGCSPIGMKKEFLTFFHNSINDHEYIYFNGGKIGYQLYLKFSDIIQTFKFNTGDLVEKETKTIYFLFSKLIFYI